MATETERPYLLDGEPISVVELSHAASALDLEYKQDWLKTTSRSAKILRSHGHSVAVNDDH